MAKNTSYFRSDDSNNLLGVTLCLEKEYLSIKNSYWLGFRSQPLHEINYEVFSKVFFEIFLKVFNTPKFFYKVNSYLHFLNNNIKNEETWWHTDSNCILAGVVYLNENPPPDSGTDLFFKNNTLKVKNVFNRLLIYNPNILHKPEFSFGDDINSARLTLTFFVESITLNSENNF